MEASPQAWPRSHSYPASPSGMMRVLIAGTLFLATAVVLPLVLAELFECAPWMASRVLHLAARHVPRAARVEQLRQWEGDVDNLPGKLMKVVFALHILLRSADTGRAIDEFRETNRAAPPASP